jgi:hypothetical protein
MRRKIEKLKLDKIKLDKYIEEIRQLIAGLEKQKDEEKPAKRY